MKNFFFFFFSPLNNTFPPSLYEAHLGAVLTRLRDTLETKGAKVHLLCGIDEYDPHLVIRGEFTMKNFFFFSPLNNTFPPSFYEAHLGAVLTRLHDTLETKGAKVHLL